MNETERDWFILITATYNIFKSIYANKYFSDVHLIIVIHGCFKLRVVKVLTTDSHVMMQILVRTFSYRSIKH